MKPLRLILPLMLCALVACKPAADDAAKPVATQAAKPDAPATPPPAKPAGIGEVPMLKVTSLLTSEVACGIAFSFRLAMMRLATLEAPSCVVPGSSATNSSPP